MSAESTPLLESGLTQKQNNTVDFEDVHNIQNGRRWIAKYQISISMFIGIGCFLLLVNSDFSTSNVNTRTRSISQFKKSSTMSITKYTSLKNDDKKELWKEFQKRYEKSYENDEEETKRYDHFINFLEKVDEHNEKENESGGTAIHGITIFSDYSSTEFKEKFLGYIAPDSKQFESRLPTAVEPYTGDLTSVDWTNIYTTEVNNQGYCGSCWAFSAVQQIESDSIRQGILSTSERLSVQELVSWCVA